MIELMVFAVWVLLGVGSAALFAAPGESRWRWSPMAVFLGPFWIEVVLDRRRADS